MRAVLVVGRAPTYRRAPRRRLQQQDRYWKPANRSSAPWSASEYTPRAKTSQEPPIGQAPESSTCETLQLGVTAVPQVTVRLVIGA